jgi:hypothetical protein
VYNKEFEQNWELILVDRWTGMTDLTSGFQNAPKKTYSKYTKS